jgi:hypothetical protein
MDFSSYGKDKKIFDNWRKFLNENDVPFDGVEEASDWALEEDDDLEEGTSGTHKTSGAGDSKPAGAEAGGGGSAMGDAGAMGASDISPVDMSGYAESNYHNNQKLLAEARSWGGQQGFMPGEWDWKREIGTQGLKNPPKEHSWSKEEPWKETKHSWQDEGPLEQGSPLMDRLQKAQKHMGGQGMNPQQLRGFMNSFLNPPQSANTSEQPLGAPAPAGSTSGNWRMTGEQEPWPGAFGMGDPGGQQGGMLGGLGALGGLANYKFPAAEKMPWEINPEVVRALFPTGLGNPFTPGAGSDTPVQSGHRTGARTPDWVQKRNEEIAERERQGIPSPTFEENMAAIDQDIADYKPTDPLPSAVGSPGWQQGTWLPGFSRDRHKRSGRRE